jgi:hypothetical protein
MPRSRIAMGGTSTGYTRHGALYGEEGNLPNNYLFLRDPRAARSAGGLACRCGRRPSGFSRAQNKPTRVSTGSWLKAAGHRHRVFRSSIPAGVIWLHDLGSPALHRRGRCQMDERATAGGHRVSQARRSRTTRGARPQAHHPGRRPESRPGMGGEEAGQVASARCRRALQPRHLIAAASLADRAEVRRQRRA